jgi:3-hydroxy-D-aspartate aldolase
MRRGAIGQCVQKVSEAEALAWGGVPDILVSNQVIAPRKLARLAALSSIAKVAVCADDLRGIAVAEQAAETAGIRMTVLVEIDVGSGRCGVEPGPPAVALAERIAASPHLIFGGLQAYHGSAQHRRTIEQRQSAIAAAAEGTRRTVEQCRQRGLDCAIVGGAGTGTFAMEAASGVWTEIQAGSYAFMDADYGRILDKDGKRIDQGEWENALFILTSVMSHAKPAKAICDAGLKAQSVDSGLPVIFGRTDVKYVKCSDEHGVIDDPDGVLKVNDKLRLVPGHCDPTCNVHDWYVGVRGGKVEVVWPVSARGKAY